MEKSKPNQIAEDTKTVLPAFETSHQLEQEVSRHLVSQPTLRFSSLVVHRTPGGVCLEGRLESQCDCDDVTRLALQVAGVDDVLNRLVLCPTGEIPRE